MTIMESFELKSYDPGRLLVYLKQILQVKSDIALSKTLRVSHQLLVAIREQKLAITGAVLILMQEVSQVSIAELRRILGDRRRTCRMPALLF
jgi:hypothetical protein